jgi:hypothetical protein
VLCDVFASNGRSVLLLLLFPAEPPLFFVDALEITLRVDQLLLSINKLKDGLDVVQDNRFVFWLNSREASRADRSFRPVLWRKVEAMHQSV